MNIALAQYNPVVGDIRGNTARSERLIREAARRGADLVVFGELSVVGYPPRDLLVKDGFVSESVQAVERLARSCTDVAALVGYVRPNPDTDGRPLQNAAALLRDGRVDHVQVKSLLPTYDVFDETRYFQPGGRPETFEVSGVPVGLSICEDLWDADALGRELYGQDPVAMLAGQGARVIVNMAASPYHMGKAAMREELFVRQAARSGAAVVYVNQVGGNDELIFDGGSCVVEPGGGVVGRAGSFREDLLVVDLDGREGRVEAMGEPLDRLADALRLGLRDYVTKCGFSSVVLGLSGGIDSAVTAVLAADALGPENVLCLAMPSRYSSDHSLSDALDLARRGGMPCKTVPIEAMHAAFESELSECLSADAMQTAAENVQARIRGTIVMAWSNAMGHLALATGNKSELSVGYCTLYGDMAGGLAPIGDVLKTQVYRLAEQLNAGPQGERIPRSILTKPPSAELKPDQVDQDKLPPYDLLDRVLCRYIERDESVSRIVADGLDAEVVGRIVRMVDLAEYKRQQAAPVLKVSPRAFGAGRRMPIAQRYLQAVPSA
jgi:NAD+ synthase/NAD+ synthase (glutamine-hydrolysing)